MLMVYYGKRIQIKINIRKSHREKVWEAPNAELPVILPQELPTHAGFSQQ